MKPYQYFLLFGAIAATPLFGDTISMPGYTYNGICGPSSYQTSCAQSNYDVGSGGSSYDIANFGLNSATGPYVYASDDSNTAQNSARSNLLYYVEVNGPAGNVLVDIDYSIEESVQYSPPAGNDEDQQGGGDAKLGVQGTTFSVDMPLQLDDFGGSVENNLPSEFSVTSGATLNSSTNTWTLASQGVGQVTLATGTPYLMAMYATAASNAQGPGFEVTSITQIDPIFSIDSSQSNGGEYSFAFSAGIGNGAAAVTPEPAAASLLGLGLGGLAFLARRCRKR